MKTRFIPMALFILILWILAVAFTSAAPAAGATPQKQVVLLDIPRLDLAEITPAYPNWTRFLTHSATGLVAPMAANAANPGQIYLSFNGGADLKSPADGYLIVNGRETVQNQKGSDLYQSLTGIRVFPRQAVNLNINVITNLNLTTALPGATPLGQILHRRGLKTAAVGNTDTSEPGRLGAALAMDQNGRIDYGAVGAETLRNDPLVPYGIRSDTDRILQYCHFFKNKADFIVVTLGDLERIESFQEYLDDARKAYFRRIALRRYDDFLGRLARQTDFSTTQFVVFTCLPPEKLLNDTTGLTPLIIRGPGFDSGVLTSPTTRRPGIITYHDLRENLIRFLIAPAAAKTPAALERIPGDWRRAATAKTDLDRNYFARWPLLTVYGVLLIGLVLLLVCGMVFGFRVKILKLFNQIYLFLLTIPAVFLLAALLNPLGWIEIILICLGCAALIFAFSYLIARGDPFKILALVSLINACLILLDGLWNGRSEMNSFLGYSVISGGRFYGIGNEYLGVLLGSLIVAVSINPAWIRRWRPGYFWAGVALVSLILFLPFWGAKVGGGLTAILGLSITVCLWLKRPLHAKDIGKFALIAFLAFVVSGFLDYANHNGMSHLGRLFAAIGQEGPGAFWAIVLRKLELNWDLILSTPLTFVLIAILAAIPILYKRPPAWLRAKIAQYPETAAGLTGLCVTALIALALNDTGIAAAALMFMYGAAMIFAIAVTERAASALPNGIPAEGKSNYE